MHEIDHNGMLISSNDIMSSCDASAIKNQNEMQRINKEKTGNIKVHQKRSKCRERKNIGEGKGKDTKYLDQIRRILC